MTEHEKATSAPKEVLFIQLASMFHLAAMQHLGKLINPVTDKMERDLAQAKFSIDTLEMLKEKTEGNLTSTEAEFLDKILFELHMNYVDELGADKKKETAQEKTEGEPGEGGEKKRKKKKAKPKEGD